MGNSSIFSALTKIRGLTSEFFGKKPSDITTKFAASTMLAVETLATSALLDIKCRDNDLNFEAWAAQYLPNVDKLQARLAFNAALGL